jgi:hypothetical protein
VRLLLLGSLLLSLSAGAVEARGDVRAWAGPGFDSNARRDFVSANTSALPDFFAYGLLQTQGLLDFGRFSLAGSYDVGARKFVLLPSEDTVLQAAQLEATAVLGKAFNLGLTGHARDRRGASRDYTDLGAELFVDFLPTAQVDVRVKGGPHRFLYWDRFEYSSSGPEFGLEARYRLNRRHSFALSGGLSLRTYNGQTHADPADTDPAPSVRRADTVASAGVSWSYRGPFHLSVGYSYFDETSNSFGETLRRHRLSVTAGVVLPWQLTILATGALQLSLYPDGVYLSPELQVLQDDENATSASLKLVRSLSDHVDLDLRYAVAFATLPQNAFTYQRHVVSLGVAVHF